MSPKPPTYAQIKLKLSVVRIIICYKIDNML